MSPTLIPRFWAKVKVGELSDCWIWLGGTSGQGYGYIWVEGNKLILVHRLAYNLAYEVTVPKGVDIHHTCYNKRCVNYTHLQALDHAEHGKITAEDFNLTDTDPIACTPQSRVDQTGVRSYPPSPSQVERWRTL